MNRAQRGVLGYLERAESKEGDAWYAQDYRLAQHVITLSDEGIANPYAVAFLKAYGRPAEQITWWWRDRSALMRLALACGSATPLLHANQAEEVLSQIPDYDPTLQVSSGGAHAERLVGDISRRPYALRGPRTEADNPLAVRGGQDGEQSQAGPLGKLSADPSCALPPKKPASRISQGSGEPSAKREAGRKKGA